MAKTITTPVSIVVISMLLAPKVRHSDENIELIRLRILEKKEKAEKESEFLQTLIESSNGPDEKSAFGVKTNDDLIDLHAKMDNKILKKRQDKFVVSLKKALLRVEDKSIGVCFCNDCKGEKLIAIKRMLATPNTTMCPEGKRLKAIAEGKSGLYIEDL